MTPVLSGTPNAAQLWQAAVPDGVMPSSPDTAPVIAQEIVPDWPVCAALMGMNPSAQSYVQDPPAATYASSGQLMFAKLMSFLSVEMSHEFSSQLMPEYSFEQALHADAAEPVKPVAVIVVPPVEQVSVRD